MGKQVGMIVLRTAREKTEGPPLKSPNLKIDKIVIVRLANKLQQQQQHRSSKAGSSFMVLICTTAVFTQEARGIAMRSCKAKAVAEGVVLLFLLAFGSPKTKGKIVVVVR